MWYRGNNLASIRQRCGHHLIEVGLGAVGGAFSVVGAHIEVVAGLGGEAYEGIMHGVDDGPGCGSLAVSHGGYLPGGLVGKLGHVLLPCGGNGAVGNLGGDHVNHSGHGVVGGEGGAHPRRGTFAAAVVLHIEGVGGGRCHGKVGRQLGDTAAGLGHAVEGGIVETCGGAEYVVEVIGLSGLGLLPGGYRSGLAGLLDADVGHHAAGAEGAEAVGEPLAVAVIVATGLAVRAHIYIVFGVGSEAGEVGGQGRAFILVGACIGGQGGGVKLTLALDDLIAAQIVGGDSRPGDGRRSLVDISGLDGGHSRAGLVGLAIGSGKLGQETLYSTGVSQIARTFSITGATGTTDTIEAD